MHVAQQWSEEGSRRPKAVDAQGIVRTVLVGPFCMVDKSWRQRVEVEVAHAVASHHHGRLLLVEGIHHLLQRMGRGVEVVAVELNGKPSAPRIVHRLIPAPAYAQIPALRGNHDKLWVMSA